MNTIENQYLKVEIAPKGGNLVSIIDKSSEKNLMYEPDPRAWGGTDVVIFPFVARLYEGTYTVDNKEYKLKNHGVARYYIHQINKISDSKIQAILKYNEQTLAEYPYKFLLTVTYSLENKELTISYNVKNLDDKSIYFSLGGHPALKVDGHDDEQGFIIENTKLEFENDIDTYQYVLDETGSYIMSKENIKLPKIFNVDKRDIENAKTYIFDAKDINKVILHTLNRKYTFDTSSATVLALWSIKGFGNYLCVEPWWGIPDYYKPDKELKNKPLINKLDVNEEFNSYYKIEF